MTPELRHSVAGRARALQGRLNQFSVGAIEAATEAMRIFEDVDDDVRCRWLTLELGGYAEHVDSRALHQVLGVPPGHRLAAHVTAYRTQRGVDATLDATVHGAPELEVIRWSKLPARVAPTQDHLRVTEEGAVAIALALSARHCRWRVVRCLQSRLGEGADWLMVDPSKRRIVLEVGGTDEGSLGALLSGKTEQARSSIFSRHGRPAACVVRFAEPRALLASDHEPR